MTLQEIIADLNSPRKKKVVLDTDAFNEIDDQYAIAYCYLSERIDLLSVHAALFVHNAGDSTEEGMLKSFEEAKKVLSLTDPDYTTPVLKGCAETIDKKGTFVESEATDRLIEIAKESDEIIYVLAIGTGTNVASSVMKDPSIKDKICVIWLACNQFHVNTPIDYNLEQDYKAGQILFDSGVPLMIVPGCWVTSVLRSDIENTRALLGSNAICDYLFEITEAVPEISRVQLNADPEPLLFHGLSRHGHDAAERVKDHVAWIGIPIDQPVNDIYLERAVLDYAALCRIARIVRDLDAIHRALAHWNAQLDFLPCAVVQNLALPVVYGRTPAHNPLLLA